MSLCMAALGKNYTKGGGGGGGGGIYNINWSCLLHVITILPYKRRTYQIALTPCLIVNHTHACLIMNHKNEQLFMS